MRRALVFAGLTLGLLVLAGATVPAAEAQGQSAPSAPAAAAPDTASLARLKERVLAYWQARVRKDYRAEYDLLEPRARVWLNPDEYGRGRVVEFLAAQVEGVERRGNFARANVRLLVRVLHPLAGPGGRTDATLFPDHWVLINGEWYRSQEADLGAPGPWPIPPN
jgi:hypothetical protein